MSIRLCDRAAFAIIAVPGAGPKDPIDLSLYHWRHIPDARKTTEVQLLGSKKIDSPDGWQSTAILPGSTESDQSWAKQCLAPELETFSEMVPMGITVAIFVPESIHVDSRCLRDAIEKHCPTTAARKVTFQFEHSTGSLEMCLRQPRLEEEFVVVYTMEPVNELTVYKCSGFSFTRLKSVSTLKKFNFPTDKKEFDGYISEWAKSQLSPALKSIEDSNSATKRLFLPTKGLYAEPDNPDNFARDQIMNELHKLESHNIVFAGSSDMESSDTIIGRGVEKPKSPYLTKDKFMMYVDAGPENIIISVSHWNGTRAIDISHVPTESNNITEEGISSLFTKSVKSLEEYGGRNIISIPVFFSGSALKHDIVFNCVMNCSKGPAAWDPTKPTWFDNRLGRFISLEPLRLRSKTSKGGTDDDVTESGDESDPKPKDEDVLEPVTNHIVVVDAGSTGTRAVLYRHTSNDPNIESIFSEGEIGVILPVALPWMFYVGEVDVKQGIHEQQAVNIVAYLDSLFTKLNVLQANKVPPVNRATTPLIGVATGGMRGRRDEHGPNGDHAYQLLLTAITTYFAGENLQPRDAPALPFRPHHFQAGHRSFVVATGDQEAIYGWITANYSMGRLEAPVPDPSYGFLEMGGQSVQIAYEVQPGSTQARPQVQTERVPCLIVIMNATPQRQFTVSTKMISGLGTSSARVKYLRTPLPDVTLANVVTRYDRCSIQDQDIPGGASGSGLRIPPGRWTTNETVANEIVVLNQSLLLVEELLKAVAPTPPRDVVHRILLHGAPVVLPTVVRFVGGSSFWHANRSLYLHNVNPQHRLDYNRLNRLIGDFASKDWDTHLGELMDHTTTILSDMDNEAVRRKVDTGRPTTDRATVRGRTFKGLEGFRRNALFCALLVHSTLYEGIKLPHDAHFQPFNGGVGLYDGDPNKNVPYSWTLGRALLEVTRAVHGAQVPWVQVTGNLAD